MQKALKTNFIFKFGFFESEGHSFALRVKKIPLAGAGLLDYHDDPAVFLTRFITHLCAPGFFLAMGIGMHFLARARKQKGWSEGRIVRFFLIRALIIVLVSQLIENPAWLVGIISGAPRILRGVGPSPGGGADLPFLVFGVLFALAGCMAMTAFLRRLPSIILVLLGIAIPLVLQWLLPGPSDFTTVFHPLERLFYIPGRTGVMMVTYPILPWLGLTLLGVVLGRSLEANRQKTMQAIALIGLLLLLTFFLLRIFSEFGSPQPYAGGDWIDLMRVTKYPPSLTFICWTIAIDLLLLVGLYRFFRARQKKTSPLDKENPAPESQNPGKFTNPLLVFGKAPFFFYLAHLWLYALISLLFPYGLDFPGMYLVWLIGLVLLYPLCKWFIRFKGKKPINSFWRFF